MVSDPGNSVLLNQTGQLEEATWEYRMALDPVVVTPTDRTVAGIVHRYLEPECARAESKDLSGAEFDKKRRCLEHFRDWAGPETAIDAIDAQRFEAYWQELVRSPICVDYKKARLRHARTLLGWAASIGEMPLLPNLSNRRYRFRATPKEIQTMNIEEVQKLIEAAPGQLKLHLLLMANCGMTQVDIANLRQTEVDLEGGRITRKRTKTDDKGNVPVVSYRLWPLTLELLRECRAEGGELALLTSNGRQWLRDEVIDGKRSKVDIIQTSYARLRKKLANRGVQARPMKLIRKTSASMLDEHESFNNFVDHFLGHAPRTIAYSNYARRSQSRFDEAVAWIGQRYGYVE